MKRKTFGIVFSVLLLLGGAVSLSLASSIPQEKHGREEEISDKEIQQPSCEVPSDRKMCIRDRVYTFPVLCPVTVEKLRKIVFQLVNDLHI